MENNEEKSKVKGFTDNVRTVSKTVDAIPIVGGIAGSVGVAAAGAIDAANEFSHGNVKEGVAELAAGAVEAAVVAAPGVEYVDAAAKLMTGETLSTNMANSVREYVKDSKDSGIEYSGDKDKVTQELGSITPTQAPTQASARESTQEQTQSI